MNRIQIAIIAAGVLALTVLLTTGVAYGWTGHMMGEPDGARQGVKYGSITDTRPGYISDHGQILVVDSWRDAEDTAFELWMGGITLATIAGVLLARRKPAV